MKYSQALPIGNIVLNSTLGRGVTGILHNQSLFLDKQINRAMINIESVK